MIRFALPLALALSAMWTLVHIFAGGADVHAPILTSPLDPVLKGYVTVLWHGITAVLILNTAALALALRRNALRQVLCTVVAAQYAAFAALFIATSLIRFGNLWSLPPWTGFVLIVACLLPHILRRSPNAAA